MTDRKPQSQDKFILRLPDGLRERIKALAQQNKRSMNAEILAAIEAHVTGAVAGEKPVGRLKIEGDDLKEIRVEIGGRTGVFRLVKPIHRMS